MKKKDSDDFLVEVVVVLIIIAVIVFVIIAAAAFIVGIGMISGAAYGGYKSIRNYCSSFNENMIQSNKKPMAE